MTAPVEKRTASRSQPRVDGDPTPASTTAEPFAPWGRGSSEVRKVVASLTRAQRQYVKDGCIHGDCTMTTVRALKRKGLFYLVITSPNGQCGHMELTPLGKAVQATLANPASKAKAQGVQP